MEIIQASLSGIPLVRIIGDLDHFSSSALNDAVQDALGLDDSCVLLDFTECPYLDSSGLGVILTALRKIQGKGWLGVVGCSSDLLRVFTISGLTAQPEVRAFVDLHEASLAVEMRDGGDPRS